MDLLKNNFTPLNLLHNCTRSDCYVSFSLEQSEKFQRQYLDACIELDGDFLLDKTGNYIFELSLYAEGAGALGVTCQDRWSKLAALRLGRTVRFEMLENFLPVVD